MGGHPAGRRPTPGTGPLTVVRGPAGRRRPLAKRFDYAVPDQWRDEVRVGTRVRVRLHGRPVGGWVVEDGRGAAAGGDAAADRRCVWPRAAGRGDRAGRVGRLALGGAGGHACCGRPRPSATSATASRPRVPVAVARPGRPRRLAPELPPACHRLPTRCPWCWSAIDRAPGAGQRGGVGAERRVGRAADGPAPSPWQSPVARDWAEAAAGWPVVVGSRAAAWAPVPRLAAAVVVDAHDEAYRDRCDAAREVLAERAARDGAPCVLLSPCPTAVQVARYPLVVPRPSGPAGRRSRWSTAGRPTRSTGLLSEELVHWPIGSCRRWCHWSVCSTAPGGPGCWPVPPAASWPGASGVVAPSSSDDDEVLRVPGVRHRAPGGVRLLRCHPAQGAPPGGVTGARGAGGAARAAGGRGRRSAARPVPDAPVLVGTEAVLHRVRRAAAVVFLDFDQHLLAPRFTAAEEALALLARAGRLVGGGGSAGSGPVLVQTRLPDHEVLARPRYTVTPACWPTTSWRCAENSACRQLLCWPRVGPGGRRVLPHPRDGRRSGVSDLGDGRWLVRAPDHRVLCDALPAAPAAGSAGSGSEVDPTDVVNPLEMAGCFRSASTVTRY